MTKTNRLKIEAGTLAKLRGHTLVRWKNLSGPLWEATCPICGKWVQVNVSPPPNGISIGGTAVALNCKDKEK